MGVDKLLRLKLNTQMVVSLEVIFNQIFNKGISLEDYLKVERNIKKKVENFIPLDILYKIDEQDKLTILEDLFRIIEGYLICEYFQLTSDFFNKAMDIISQNFIPVGFEGNVFIVIEIDELISYCSDKANSNLTKEEFSFKENVENVQNEILLINFFENCGKKLIDVQCNLDLIQVKTIKQANKNLQSIHFYNETQQDVYRYMNFLKEELKEKILFSDIEIFFTYKLKPILMFKTKKFELEPKAFWQIYYLFVNIYPHLLYGGPDIIQMKLFEIFKLGYMPCGYIKKTNKFRIY